jgi:hypothetical protein
MNDQPVHSDSVKLPRWQGSFYLFMVKIYMVQNNELIRRRTYEAYSCQPQSGKCRDTLPSGTWIVLFVKTCSMGSKDFPVEVAAQNNGVVLPIIILPLILFVVVPWIMVYASSLAETTGTSSNMGQIVGTYAHRSSS